MWKPLSFMWKPKPLSTLSKARLVGEALITEICLLNLAEAFHYAPWSLWLIAILTVEMGVRLWLVWRGSGNVSGGDKVDSYGG